MRNLSVFLGALLCIGWLSASSGLEKIDLEVHRAFTNMSQATKKPTEGVRIVVHLTRPQEAASFSAKSGAGVVAAQVTNNQQHFLRRLKAEHLHVAQSFKTGDRGFRVALLLKYQHAVAGYVSDSQSLQDLAKLPEVKKIDLDHLNELFTVEGRNLTGSTAVANQGWGGAGVGVAVIDGQFDLLHPELGGNTILPNGTVFGGWNFSNDTNQIHSQTWNDCFHGTGTASIVGRYAPDSDLYALVVFPNSFDSVIAEAINWSITNRNGVNGGDPIRVISMSLGGGQHTGLCTGLIHDAAGDALNNDIIVLAASGNDGWTNAIASPACSNNIIAVGATWDETGAAYAPFPPANCNDNNRIVDERTCYSNRSWKVNVYAPSEEVITASCGGGTAALGGTSSACPAAAGMVAQLLSMNANFIGDRQGVIDLFTDTGAPVAGAYYPRRRIDIAAAIASCATAPATPAFITGPNYDPCIYSDVTYQIPAVNNATEYEWEINGIHYSTPGPSFTLYTGTLTPGWHTLRVRALNCAGQSGWRSQSIRILSTSDPQCAGCGRLCERD